MYPQQADTLSICLCIYIRIEASADYEAICYPYSIIYCIMQELEIVYAILIDVVSVVMYLL